MDIVRRLIFVLLVSVVSSVWAVIVPPASPASGATGTVTVGASRDFYVKNDKWFLTAPAACSAFGGPTAVHVYDHVEFDGIYAQCFFRDTTVTSGSGLTHYGDAIKSMCPVNTLPDISKMQCIPADCPDGQIRNSSGVCESKCKAGEKSGPGFTQGGDRLLGTYCVSGCSVDTVQSVGPSGVSKWFLIKNGATCNVESAPDIPPDNGSGDTACPAGAAACPPVNGQCPKGTYAEEIGGSAVCIAIPKNPDAPPSSPDGGASGVADGKNTSGSSSSSTSSTTTSHTTQNADGSTTTTTTTTTTGTESKPNDMASFCSQNPGTTICQDGGSWAGSCSGFTCGGDAVQCAQAQAAWQIKCALTVADGDPNKGLGQQVVDGTLPNADPRQSGTGDVDVSNQIDQSNPYTDVCPGDLEVPIGSYGSITVPFSRACPYFQFAGYVAVACALAVAAKIALGET